MNKLFIRLLTPHKYLIGLSLLTISMASTLELHALGIHGYTFLSPRSTSIHGGTNISGSPIINDTQKPFYQNPLHATYCITPRYQRSYKSRRIAEYFFNTDLLEISGSNTSQRGENDLLADYFGLSPAFRSTVELHPVIQTFSADFSYAVNLDRFLCDTYFTIHAPIVHTRWHMKLQETIVRHGTIDGTKEGTPVPFPALYMAPTAIPAPLDNFADALNTGATYGHVTETLAYGRISPCSLTKLRLADIRMALGWHVLTCNRSHIDLHARISIPMGNRSKSIYLFEPMIGNGRHFSCGAGISGHVILWENEPEHSFAFHGDFNINHLFKSRNVRSFDINDTFGSRYMLVKEFDPATRTYTGKTSPAINHTTFNCSSVIQAEIDVTGMFSYKYNGLGIDIGYNCWGRTRERIDACKVLAAFPSNTYAFKGIQNVALNSADPASTSIITQSTATLNGNSLSDLSNPLTLIVDQAAVADATSPVFIKPSDLNISSAETPGVISHTLFTHIGYAWDGGADCRFHPYIGVGGEIEFEGRHRRRQAPKITIPQWGLWAKVGLSY